MTDTEAPRRLTTILAADVVGYSRLVAADEVGTIERFKSLYDSVFLPNASRYNGRVVKLMGDGLLMEFGSVVDAVNFAGTVQPLSHGPTPTCLSVNGWDKALGEQEATLRRMLAPKLSGKLNGTGRRWLISSGRCRISSTGIRTNPWAAIAEPMTHAARRQRRSPSSPAIPKLTS